MFVMPFLSLPLGCISGCLFFPHSLRQLMIFLFFLGWITSLFHIWFQKVNVIDFAVLIFCFVLHVIHINQRYCYWDKGFFFLFLCVCLCPFPTGAFEDEDIIHVEGTVDPVRDMEIIHEELRLKDVEMIVPIIDKLEKTAIRGGDKKLKPEYVSQCPSRPFAPPHSKAQIITLPHTRPCRKSMFFFF